MDRMSVLQLRRSCLGECFGGPTKFEYYAGATQFAHSSDNANGFCRQCCARSHPFTMRIYENNSGLELLTVDRPYRCFRQEASFTSGSKPLGSVKEDSCDQFVPAAHVYNSSGEPIYLLQPPTCCNGCCYDCCGHAGPCYKPPFLIFPVNEQHTHGDDAPPIGVIQQISEMGQVGFSGYVRPLQFSITFPENATPEQKATLLGSSIFLNSVFFAGTDYLQYPGEY